MILAAVATDPTPLIAIITALGASVAAGFAYRRGRIADERTNDLDTLRELVSTFQEENKDQRARMTQMERDHSNRITQMEGDHSARITQLSGRLDDCEREKSATNVRLAELQIQVIQLKAASNG